MKTQPILLWTWILSLILLQGCSAKTPTPGVHFPITSGSHRLLPTAEAKIILWGDPDMTDMALDWLRAHHYARIVVPDHGRPRVAQGSSDVSDRRAALAFADNLHAEFVLFLERETSKEGALIEPSCGARFVVHVSLYGLSARDGATVLQANAHYPNCVELNERTMRNLTCQAFATAWGFRPSGQLELPSNLMCTAGQTEAVSKPQ